MASLEMKCRSINAAANQTNAVPLLLPWRQPFPALVFQLLWQACCLDFQY